jgi:hypothetical protein
MPSISFIRSLQRHTSKGGRLILVKAMVPLYFLIPVAKGSLDF